MSAGAILNGQKRTLGVYKLKSSVVIEEFRNVRGGTRQAIYMSLYEKYKYE